MGWVDGFMARQMERWVYGWIDRNNNFNFNSIVTPLFDKLFV